MRHAGSVHGRFQPLHNEHLEYILAAKKECEYLWIGITKYDIAPTEATPLGSQRERPENNPFTYFERINIIAESLLHAGVPRANFGFIPFPIETPNRLPEFLPLDISCFTTICEAWNEEKIRILRALGYEVIVLWERQHKGITGAVIREKILSGDHLWEEMVPPATRKWVETLSIRDRLMRLTRTGGVSPISLNDPSPSK